MKLNSHSLVASLALPALVLAALVSLGCGHESSASHGDSAPVAESNIAEPVAPVAVENESPAADPASAAPATGDPASAEPAPAESVAAPQSTPSTGVESPDNDAEAVVAKQGGQRPPADRTPTRPGEAEKITFDDLVIGMQADIVFRPFMLSDRAKELDGKRVSIAGYMYGAVESVKGNKEFIVLRNKECKFGQGGQADHLARVFLRQGNKIDFTIEPIKVEGDLVVEPFQGIDGNTWAIYRLDDAVVK